MLPLAGSSFTGSCAANSGRDSERTGKRGRVSSALCIRATSLAVDGAATYGLGAAGISIDGVVDAAAALMSGCEDGCWATLVETIAIAGDGDAGTETRAGDGMSVDGEDCAVDTMAPAEFVPAPAGVADAVVGGAFSLSSSFTAGSLCSFCASAAISAAFLFSALLCFRSRFSLPLSQCMAMGRVKGLEAERRRLAAGEGDPLLVAV